MEDFLTFRKMLSPVIIQTVFLVSVILCIAFGIYLMWGGGLRILLGLLLLLLGPFVIRIWCETVLLLFRINRNLTEIRRNTSSSRPQSSDGDR